MISEDGDSGSAAAESRQTHEQAHAVRRGYVAFDTNPKVRATLADFPADPPPMSESLTVEANVQAPVSHAVESSSVQSHVVQPASGYAHSDDAEDAFRQGRICVVVVLVLVLWCVWIIQKRNETH